MKKAVKAIVTAIMFATLLLPTVLAATLPDPTAGAAGTDAKASDSREEVVYANLTADGEIKDVYVVNILTNKAAGPVADHGGFAAVKNLTNTDALTLTGDGISVNAPAGAFYYQAALINAELPWLIDVSYYLDGEKLAASELAGKSGHAEIRISTAKNENADPSYFENYLLQISVTLDNAACQDILAPDGAVANAGGDKLITFTVMPGDAAELAVTADVTDFTMQGIEFAALPMSLSIDAPDSDALSGDLASLSDAVVELNDAVKEMHSGSYDLNTGAADLKSGSSSFADGLWALSGSSGELVSGSAEIMNALIAISSSMDGSSGGLDVEALSRLPDTLDQLSDGLDGVSAALTDLNTAFSASYTALDTAISEIPDSEISQQELAALYQANPGQKDTLDQLSAYYASAAKVKGTYQAVRAAFDAVGPALGESAGSLDMMSQSLTAISEQVRDSLSGTDTVSMMLQLSESLITLSANYEDFHAGLVAFTSGVSSIAYNYGEMNTGIGGISDGIAELYDGIGQLYEGTTELRDATADMPEQVDDEIQEMIGSYDKSDFIPASFISDKNTNTISVQFILKTDKIEKTEIETAEPETAAENETLWTRFLALFK